MIGKLVIWRSERQTI